MKKQSFKKSLREASKGLVAATKTERNVGLQLTVAVLVFILGFLFRIARLEWVALILIMTIVLTLELMNTALEACLDVVNPRLSTQVAYAKNVMAAAVLLAALAAIVIGLVIFAPYLVESIW